MSSSGLGHRITHPMVGGDQNHNQSYDEGDILRILEIFNEISLIFIEDITFEQKLTSMLEQVLILTGMENGGIYLKDRTNGDYILTVHSPVSEEFKQKHGRITYEWEYFHPVIIEGKVMVVPGTSIANISPERKRSTIKEGFLSYVSIPLKNNNLVDGIIMASSSQVRQYSEFQNKLFSTIGQQVGLAMKNLGLMEEVKHSRDWYCELFENAADGMYTNDLDGTFLSLNQAGADMLGLTIKEAVGTKIRDYLNEEDIEIASAVHAQILNGMSFFVPPILEIVRKDRKKMFLEINMRPLMKDGKVVGLHGVARDIDKRFNAEKNMLVFSRALSHSIDGINISDSNHNITFINEAGAKIFGYSRSELIGQPANIFYAEEDLPNYYENVIPTLEKYGNFNGLILAREKGGKAFPLEVTLTSVFDKNKKTIANLAVFRERKKQKLHKPNKSQSQHY
ncbi:MAG: PAS domain S-box protein [ANME-2 cluster archaeon]|jgi:PAS domain S-box-containing protein|nr:PAS domain S-box protein [ANME-2 cluster archaeon]